MLVHVGFCLMRVCESQWKDHSLGSTVDQEAISNVGLVRIISNSGTSQNPYSGDGPSLIVYLRFFPSWQSMSLSSEEIIVSSG